MYAGIVTMLNVRHELKAVAIVLEVAINYICAKEVVEMRSLWM